MQLTPNTNNFNAEIEVEELRSKTYKIDLKEKRIIGMIDELEAVKQSVYKILHTERYSSLTYSWNYGVELQNLIGKDYDFILGDLQRRVEEALLQDDRIKGVERFKVNRKEKDSIVASFIVLSKYGSIPAEVDVNV